MHAIDPARTVVCAREQVSCEVGGEVVILSLLDEVYYGLDEVGARVWSLIQAPTEVAAVRDALVAEYEVSAEDAERDLLALLAQLAEKGLIEIH